MKTKGQLIIIAVPANADLAEYWYQVPLGTAAFSHPSRVACVHHRSANLVLELGDAAEEIISYVRENQVNLIAMTTNAACGMGIWPIGSVADKVIHGTSSTILLVRPH